MVKGRFLILFFFTLMAAGCERFMYDQPKFKPHEPTPFFADGNSSRPTIEDTVARGHLRLDDSLDTGLVGGQPLTRFPRPITRSLLARGRQRFDIYCAPCHGRLGDGRGVVVERGFKVKPPSFHDERLRSAPPGHFVQVMRDGFGSMYSYRDRVSPEDRWAITAYIRALQRSQNARLEDVPPGDRTRLGEVRP